MATELINTDSLQKHLDRMNLGETIPLRKTFADKLPRTGKFYRHMHEWANVYQVKIGNNLCDIYCYDTGRVRLQKGTDID